MTNGKEPVIFITGSTGFVGGAVLAHLATTAIPCRLIMLVRGETEEVCLDRVRCSATRFLSEPGVNKLLKSAAVIRGGVTDANWHNDQRLQAVTHVLHLAANTSFGVEQDIRQTNVDGALSVAMGMRNRPHLTRYLHVSTVMVCGDQPPQLVYEDDYPRESVQYPVLYPATKAQAEMLLGQLKGEIPLVVARPSIVVGHSQLGCAPSCSIYWCFRAAHALKCITWDRSGHIDVLPVDFVAGALVALLLKPSLAHSRYHISAGSNAAVMWDEISSSFGEALGEYAFAPYSKVDFAGITPQKIIEGLGAGPARRTRRAIELYYRFARLDVVFDNSRLLAEGVAAPPKFSAYIRRCVETSEHRTVYDQMRDGG